jgi:Inverse autotransporter, beta-domain
LNRIFCLSIFARLSCVLACGGLMIGDVYALSLPTRFSANGYASDYTVGEADWLSPLIGDQRHILYVDPSVSYGSDNQGYADLGLGYRWINKKARLWGIYLFGGYSRIEQNAYLWVANPGIEVFGRRWDAHLNTYFVMGDRHYRIGEVQETYFTEHSEFAKIYQISQSSGHGADVKVGYQPFSNHSLKGYLGSYFFNPKQTSSVWGGAAELEYWLDRHLKVFARYTYDRLHHHTGAIGLGLELGGTHVHRDQAPCIEERLTDPVTHYLAELGHGSAIPSSRYRKISPEPPQLLNDHIAFFSQTGTPNNGGSGLTLANCTFEYPCGSTDLTDLGVTTLRSLLPNTTMYFNGGTYKALNVVNGTLPVTLLAGQSVWGRSNDYSRPAQAAERSVFEGWLQLTDKNTVSNVVVIFPAGGGNSPGIGMLQNASDIRIMNSQVGSLVGSDARPTVGIGSAEPNGNNTAVVENVVIWARNTGVSFGGSSLMLRNGLINSGGIIPAGTSTGVRTANSTNSRINLQNVQINVHSDFSTSLFGLQAGFPGTDMIADHISIQLNASVTGAQASALLVGNNSTSLTVNDGLILSNSSAGAAYIVGGGMANEGSININRGILNMNAPISAIRAPMNASNLNIDSLSSCFINGSLVPC